MTSASRLAAGSASDCPSCQHDRRAAGDRNGICTIPAPGRAIARMRAATRPRRGGNDAMIRYGFTIRTRMGQRIESVSIIAGSQNDAERRLRQMYVQCEVLECRERSVPRRFEPNFANMIDLMSISPPTIQHHG